MTPPSVPQPPSIPQLSAIAPSSTDALPQVIFFDAVGTLFGVRGSVGEIYRDIAHQFGVAVEPAPLNRAFVHSFRTAPPMAFPGVEASQIADYEYQWWEAIAVQTFQQVGAWEQFPDFSAFFRVLYDHFATADPWELYADTRPALTHWRDQSVELGVLSNFDSRLHRVLKALELDPFFTSVTISTEVGAAKPQAPIFQQALAKHGCAPEQAWHIGDSVEHDYEGAMAMGIRAIWLNR